VTPSVRALLACGLAAALAGCAPKLAALPSGPGTAFPEGARALAEATTQCTGVRTLTAEIGLSGHVGTQRLRGRLLAGFAAPDRARLEAPAPFGRPVFTLVMRGASATLVLHRDRRVLPSAPPADVVEALAGVRIGADDLRRALAGCGFDTGVPATSQSYPGDWVVIGPPNGRRWLRRVAGAWRLVASERDHLEIRYDDFVLGRPQAVRLRSGEAGVETDITLRLSQVETNVELGPEVFEVAIPDDAAPLTLDELRRSGPLGAAPGAEPS
jgi:hypothetical protein